MRVQDAPHAAAGASWGAIFDGFVRRHETAPSLTALVDAHGSWSYRELFSLSRDIALRLRSRNVQPGDVALVAADRSAAFVASILGVLMAGARFLVVERTQIARQVVDSLPLQARYCIVI